MAYLKKKQQKKLLTYTEQITWEIPSCHRFMQLQRYTKKVTTNFPSFTVLESTEEKPIIKLSLFAIKRLLSTNVDFYSKSYSKRANDHHHPSNQKKPLKALKTTITIPNKTTSIYGNLTDTKRENPN